jgi:1-pyrroline-4-hydroxy-2-carboxylate deaminase
MSGSTHRSARTWRGVFPAVTAQFKSDAAMSLDLDATARVIDGLIDDGVSGLVINGTVGENCSLSSHERLAILETAIAVADRRVPVLCGVAEYTTAGAVESARAAAKLGADGIMLMPAMVYTAKPFESVHHFRTVGTKVDIPVMVYNNPLIYKIDVTPAMLVELQDVETIVSFKESSGDTRRFTDVINATGDRFILFAGLDDVVLESVLVGATGWVSGMSNVFPREGETLFRLAAAGRYTEALAIYRWFMPLLHLDARSDLVQCIKLCEFLVGRGVHLTRPPRMPLEAENREFVEKLVSTAIANRPSLPDVGIPLGTPAKTS